MTPEEMRTKPGQLATWRELRKLRRKSREEYRKLRAVFAAANIGIVWKAIYAFPMMGREPQELLGPASIGFLRAIDKWQPRKGALTTYATFWIRHHVRRAIERDFVVRRPSYLVNAAYRVRRAEGRGEDPSTTGLSPRVIERARQPVRVADVDAMSEILPYDPPESRPEMPPEVFIAIEKLPDFDRDVIRRRLEGETLSRIGKEHGLSRERIRQIESRAVARIREEIGL